MTYSLTRFAIYETVRDHVAKGSEGPLPFYKKVLLGSISGELPARPGTVGAGGHCKSSHVGSGVCHPRLHWRLRGDSRRYGQCQVSACPHPRSGSFPTSDGAGGLLARVCGVFSLEQALGPWGLDTGDWGAGQGEPRCPPASVWGVFGPLPPP